jgi:hypothetical protein
MTSLLGAYAYFYDFSIRGIDIAYFYDFPIRGIDIACFYDF